MDIKRKVFDEMISRYHFMHHFEKAVIEKLAEMMKDCITNGGVIQLCGDKHGEEFVNELYYRAGGVALFHGFKTDDLCVRGMISNKEKETFFEHAENLNYFENLYELDDRDMYVLVSLEGKEAILLELAKRAKAKGQKVALICNKANLKERVILDYCDLVLDLCVDEKDALAYLDGMPIGKSWTTVGNVMAQMITAELYHCYQKEGLICPVLLSANLKGADKHNNALTDPYGKRVRFHG